MTVLLRAACVVGVIFYFSPVRQADDGRGAPPQAPGVSHASLRDAILAEILAGSGSRNGAAPGLTAEAERLWRSLPPDAQRSLLERVRAAAAAPPEHAIPAEPGRTEDRHPPARPPEPPRRP